MIVVFGCLVYIQISYMDKMSAMRNSQFSENVKRSLSNVSGILERQETLHFLEQDIEDIETTFYGNVSGFDTDSIATGFTVGFSLSDAAAPRLDASHRRMQEAIRNQFLYQRGLLNEVILSIMRESASRPAFERADSTLVRNSLTTEFNNNGIEIPFEFSLKTVNNQTVYASGCFMPTKKTDVYKQLLFPMSSTRYYLEVYFPDKKDYIFESVRWLVPTLGLTLLLFIVFISTVIVAFRQKRLSEMRTDFMNNMTHELKTPVSTISLAAQMLLDKSVTKSPSMLNHISSVIIEESKRLRFLVEKVLQMSLYEKQTANFKWVEIDVNKAIESVVQNFKIKVEKKEGHIAEELMAAKSKVYVDEMHFTNVFYNLLDNAVKYMKEDTPPELTVATSNPTDSTVEIRVQDNGIGIRREHLKRVFEKFYRVPTGNLYNTKGFGLGLAYVHNIVEGFHGKIRAESEFGKGTVFIITLPTAESDEKE